MSRYGGVGGGGHLVYASTSARDPPRCVCVGGGGVRACMCVWARARKPVNTSFDCYSSVVCLPLGLSVVRRFY